MTVDDNIKVIGFGSPIVDVLVNVDDSFINTIGGAKGGMELVSPEALIDILSRVEGSAVRAPGGSAANTIFGLARLGTPTAFAGKLGNDDEADFYMAEYKGIGGDVSRFKRNPALATGRCLSLVTPDSERTMRTDLGAAATLSPEDLSSEDFQGCPHAHLEGYLLFNEQLIRRILGLARENECSVSLDLASFEVVKAAMPILPELLESVDCVFANEDEAAAFTGNDDPASALETLGKHCATAVVKVGKEGAWLKNDDEIVKVDAELVEAVDTTGAGDLWQAGFIHGFLRGQSLRDCGRNGAILGAEVVQVMGAAIPGDRWEGIRERVV